MEDNSSPSKNSTLNRRSSMLITEVDKNLEYSDRPHLSIWGP